MTGADPYELIDIWLNAFAAFPDVKPLVDLLCKDDLPMPPEIRRHLARLLSPPLDPPIDGFMLEVKRNPEFDAMLDKDLIATRYHELRAQGLKYEAAIEQAGREELFPLKTHHVGGKQAWRYVKENIRRRLLENLKGKDDLKTD